MGRVKGHGGTAQANSLRFIDTLRKRKGKKDPSLHIPGIVTEHRRAQKNATLKNMKLIPPEVHHAGFCH